MYYHLFLVPDTLFFYPKSVIALLNSVGTSSVVITLNREYLLKKTHNAFFLERVQPDGSLLDNITVLNHIRETRPHVVVLDNCFWSHTELNHYLLDGLLLLQQDVPFLLANVLPVSVFNNRDSQDIVQREKAKHVYYPDCRISQASWTTLWSSNTHFYQNSELEKDVGHISTTYIKPELYKTAYKLFQGIQSLKLRNDMDLFTLFLDSLRVKHLDEHLFRLVLTVHRFYFETLGQRQQKKDQSLSATEMNDLFERLNKPVLSLIENNRGLFDELISFFA